MLALALPLQKNEGKYKSRKDDENDKKEMAMLLASLFGAQASGMGGSRVEISSGNTFLSEEEYSPEGIDRRLRTKLKTELEHRARPVVERVNKGWGLDGVDYWSSDDEAGKWYSYRQHESARGFYWVEKNEKGEAVAGGTRLVEYGQTPDVGGCNPANPQGFRNANQYSIIDPWIRALYNQIVAIADGWESISNNPIIYGHHDKRHPMVFTWGFEKVYPLFSSNDAAVRAFRETWRAFFATPAATRRTSLPELPDDWLRSYNIKNKTKHGIHAFHWGVPQSFWTNNINGLTPQYDVMWDVKTQTVRLIKYDASAPGWKKLMDGGKANMSFVERLFSGYSKKGGGGGGVATSWPLRPSKAVVREARRRWRAGKKRGGKEGDCEFERQVNYLLYQQQWRKQRA